MGNGFGSVMVGMVWIYGERGRGKVEAGKGEEGRGTPDGEGGEGKGYFFFIYFVCSKRNFARKKVENSGERVFVNWINGELTFNDNIIRLILLFPLTLGGFEQCENSTIIVTKWSLL